MINPAGGNKERLQTATPVLWDIILKTAMSYRRTLYESTQMIEMGVFTEEAERLRELALKSQTHAFCLALVEHRTKKLLLGKPKTQEDSQGVIGLNITFSLHGLTRERSARQDKSIGLVILTARNEFDTLPTVTSLLIEEKNPVSPAGVMIVREQGVDLFFRSLNTIEQTKEENKSLVDRLRGMSIKDFAKLHQLRHFYCPTEATIATPVLT